MSVATGRNAASHALPALLAAATWFAGCAAPAVVAPAAADPRPSVEAFLQGYLGALERREEAALRSAYVADGRFSWLEDGKLRYRSADEVVAALKGFAPGARVRTELAGLTVVPLGPQGAYAWANFRTTVGTPPSGFAFGGAITFVLERRGDTWAIVGGHTSSEGRR
jgi:hypothetical protein